jgi:hypothetical protein
MEVWNSPMEQPDVFKAKLIKSLNTHVVEIGLVSGIKRNYTRMDKFSAISPYWHDHKSSIAVWDISTRQWETIFMTDIFCVRIVTDDEYAVLYDWAFWDMYEDAMFDPIVNK